MKKRVITAIIMALIVLPLILIGGIPFLIGVSLLISVCMYELTKANHSSLLMKIMAITFALGYTIYSYFNIDTPFIATNTLLIILPFIVFTTISLFDKKRSLLDSTYCSLYVIILSLFARAMLEFRYTFNNANIIAYLLIVTTSVDSFALFVGSKFGKHRLNERISPKKSIEGSIGGILGGTLLATLFSTFFPIFTNGDYLFLNLSFTTNIIGTNLLYSLLITLLLTVIGQIGDLAFSMIKRNYEVKDFSNVLPGHGGFLDRIDSLCFNSLVLGIILSLMFIL